MLNTWQISISTFSDAHWIIKFSVQHKNNKKQALIKINEGFEGNILSDMQCLHSAALIVIASMLKETHHMGLMMLAFFLPVPLKIRMACFGPFQYVICGIHGLINVKSVLNKVTDVIPIWNLTFWISFNFFSMQICRVAGLRL